jgi:hypothetical protein
MRTRLPLLLGLVLMLSAAGYTVAVTDTPAAPASDPFLALSDITSSAPAERAVCPCQPGINCCGDQPPGASRAWEPCGINWACRCNPTTNKCVTPPTLE